MRRLFIALSCACSCICSDPSRETGAGVDVLAHARTLRTSGETDRAEAYLRAQMPRLERKEQACAHGLLGRLLLQRGDWADAERELSEGFEAQLALAQTAQALADGFALTYLHAEVKGDLERARAVLLRIAPHARDRAEDRAALAHHHALVAYHASEPRLALSFLDGALAERATDLPPALSRAVRALSAAVLADTGRFAAAHREATEELLLAETLGPCEQTDAFNRRGWYALLASLTAVSKADPPFASLPDFTRALPLAEACDDPRRLAHTLVNLALSSLEERDDAAFAQRSLARAEKLNLTSEPVLFAWALEAQGRLALAQGRTEDAREAFERELSLAEARGSDASAYRALLSLGNVCWEEGARADALAKWQEADALVARLAAIVPISLGHDESFAQREDAARGAVAALVALGRVEEAEREARAALARRTEEVSLAARRERLPSSLRTRYERSLQKARNRRQELLREGSGDWKLSKATLLLARETRGRKRRAIEAALDEAHALLDVGSTTFEAPPVAAGNATLTLFPARRALGRSVWFMFVRRNGVTRVEQFAADSLDLHRELEARAVLASRGAESVTLYVHGALQQVDLHRAIAGVGAGAPAVVYASGLPFLVSPARSSQALVVADPSLTLSDSERESEQVVEVLRAQGLAVLVRSGAQATGSQLLTDLPKATFLHFAGHARVSTESPLGTGLLVAQRETVTAMDLLALERVPDRVVLSACAAGSDADGQLSLARAFLAQGAREVIAATREVTDADAREVMSAFYAEFESEDTLADALARAQQKLIARRSHADLAAFRTFVR